MPALYLLLVTALVFTLAYRLYGAFLTARVLSVDAGRPTPAHTRQDGRDYHPMHRWVLFGQHFAAISGAGPLIGPVLAAQFGYLPGFLWILIGAVLAGAVHDTVILFASMRHGARSLSRIAREEVSPLTGSITAVAIFFIIITALAGLSLVVVNALNESAWATFTIGATIPIALLVGCYMQRLRPGHIVEASAIGVVLTLAAVVAGGAIAGSELSSYFTFSRHGLALMLPLYGFAASVLPVWLLLAPRDYLSSYMKIGTVLLLAAGVFLVNPRLSMPATTAYIHGGGPIIPGTAWPFVCITIACGAISGFHALISSGTTPKMVGSEKDIRLIGYGAMLAEGFVAVMALVAACVLLPQDYLAINLAPDVYAGLGLKPANLARLSALTGEHLAGRAGGAVSLAVGMAEIFRGLPGMATMTAYWYHFAIMFEALFILTTVDAGTRAARYILQEIGLLAGVPLPVATSRWAVAICSAAVCSGWGYLVYMGEIKTIWPMFGVANQLLATLALAIGTSFILRRASRPAHALVTFLPMLFMLATTLAAGWLSIINNYLPMKSFQGYLNATLCSAMMLLVIVIAADCAGKWRHMLRRPAPALRPR
ncbi:MAG: carbon starvation protein A [Pseudomonadota bacterium]